MGTCFPNRWRKPLRAAVVLGAVALSLGLPPGPAIVSGIAGDGRAEADSTDRQPRPGASPRPNIILITTDDQTLSDLRYMPRTRRLIGAQGVTLQGVSPHPLCCPARAEILTGQYAQNNGVRSNVGTYGGYQALRPHHTIATWLADSGYTTSFLGKYLNSYRSSPRPLTEPGWDRWSPTLRGIYNYRRFATVEDGRRVQVHRLQTDYFTDRALAEIEALAPRPRPFFLWQSYVAPHSSSPTGAEDSWGLPGAARGDRGLFSHVRPPSFADPSFDETDVSDKPANIQNLPRMSAWRTRHVRALYRARLRALQAVDDGVARIVRALAATGALHNTLIIFTSDNGYLLGEHRYVGKNVPYHQALEVPFLMRGPGIPHGVTLDEVGATIDIAPTILAAGGATSDLPMDGLDLLPVLQRGGASSRDTLLIQAGPRTPHGDRYGWFFRGVRTDRYTFVRYSRTGELELYDHRLDPGELDNVAEDPAYAAVAAELQERLTALEDCKGDACRAAFGDPGSPAF